MRPCLEKQGLNSSNLLNDGSVSQHATRRRPVSGESDDVPQRWCQHHNRRSDKALHASVCPAVSSKVTGRFGEILNSGPLERPGGFPSSSTCLHGEIAVERPGHLIIDRNTVPSRGELKQAGRLAPSLDEKGYASVRSDSVHSLLLVYNCQNP